MDTTQAKTRVRPCSCDDTEACRPCWLYHNHPDYRRLWGNTSPRGPTAPARCRHFGEPLSHPDDLPMLQACCGGTGMLPVHACALHGAVTLLDCRRCADFLP